MIKKRAVPAGVGVPTTDDSTRSQVLSSLLVSGPLTAPELAQRLGLTTPAVRRHLLVLADQGLVSSRERRLTKPRGRGRPARVFVLTDAGRTFFEHRYDTFAIDALQELCDVIGPAAMDRLAASHIADVEQAFHAITRDNPGLDPVQALAQALTADGFVTSVSSVGVGQQLCLHHCPISHIARAFPQLCQAETEVFARLLGSHVQRLATIAHGDGVCTIHVPDIHRELEPEGVRS